MAKAKVQLPDGRIATIEIPDGMSMEEAQAELETMYDSQPEAFGVQASAPEQNVAQAPAQAPAQTAQQPAQESSWLDNIPHYQIPRGMLTGQADNSLSAYGAGLREAGGGMVRGARQLFNKLTGDEEELAQLNQQEEAARADFEQRTAEHPFAAGAGKLVGNVGAPLVATAAFPATAAPAVAGGLGLALRTGAGALAGAGSGAAQPLTAEEEEGGDRTFNTAVGGTVGALVPAAGDAVRRVGRALRKVDADEALEDFAGKALGTSPERGVSGAYAKVGDSIEAERDKLAAKYRELYKQVEDSGVPKPKVRLTASKKAASNLPEDVAERLSPKARSVATALREGEEKVSFKEVRDTMRELRKLERATGKTEAGEITRARISTLIERMDEDLNNWATTDTTRGVLEAARKVDEDYAKEMVPFSSKKNAIGKFRSGMKDEAAFDTQFMREDRGQAMSDLLRRVPEARESAREIYGSKLMSTKGRIKTAQSLEGGTLPEELLSKKEREYLRRVAKSVKDTKGSGAMLSPTLENILRRTGVGKLDTMLHGVEKYGQTKKNSTIIGDMLRSYTAGQFATED